MLPISAKDIIRFTPPDLDRVAAEAALRQAGAADPPDEVAVAAAEERLVKVEAAIAAWAGRHGDGPPVYLIATPTLFSRQEWRRRVAARGAAYPRDTKLADELRRLIRTEKPANADELLGAIEVVERSWGESEGEPVPEEAMERFAEIEAVARQIPSYAALIAERQNWMAVAPLVAAQCFLTGWENVGATFARFNGMATEISLEAIPEAHALAIGWAAIAAMKVEGAQRKNSKSPSMSGAAPATSTAA